MPARRHRSTPGPPSRVDAALNYSKIVEAARGLLSEDPEATMVAIASAAGVGRGTVYRHFPSREQLLVVVHGQARDDAEADQDDRLRPPGELASRTALSVSDVLNKVPPFQLADQIIAEARRIAGVTSAALYLVDLEGLVLQRLAGADTFPEQIAVPFAVGPEIPREGIAALRESIDDELPGVTTAPLFLRGRAIGVLLALGRADDALRDLAADAAAAIGLVDEYTDMVKTVRRAHHTSPAAEIQQNLLPPRIVRISGARLAGNVLPGYDIGGDWFDYAENASCAWLGIADVEGSGPRAAGLGAVILGAFRSARHRDYDVAEAAALMHDVLVEVSVREATAAAIIGRWNSATTTFQWVAFGPPSPLILTATAELSVLEGDQPLLGHPDLRPPFEIHSRRLELGERLLLVSDGITERLDPDNRPFGLHGLQAAAQLADHQSAAGTVRAIEHAVRQHDPGPLQDDATIVCLARR